MVAVSGDQGRGHLPFVLLIPCSIMSRVPAYPFSSNSTSGFSPNSPSKAPNTLKANPYSLSRPANSAASSTANLLAPSQRSVQATLSPNRNVPQSLRSVASTSSMTSVCSILRRGFQCSCPDRMVVIRILAIHYQTRYVVSACSIAFHCIPTDSASVFALSRPLYVGRRCRHEPAGTRRLPP